jgi:hypothetical protein
MIYAHVLNKGGLGVKSPLDRVLFLFVQDKWWRQCNLFSQPI